MSGEMLGPMLLSVHNLAFYQTVMRELRRAIQQDSVRQYRDEFLQQQTRGDASRPT